MGGDVLLKRIRSSQIFQENFVPESIYYSLISFEYLCPFYIK